MSQGGGNEMSCPHCGSKKVTCESSRYAHTHQCLDCGYATNAAAVKR